MVKYEGSFDASSTPAVLAKGDVVTISDAHFLFTADFSRAGHDLLMTGEDGKTLLVVDYFNGGQPPDLAAPNGALLTSSVVQSLAGPLAPGQYAQVGDQQPAAAIGKVVLLDGTASAQHTDGTVVELHVGDSVALGDVLQTGISSSMGVTFEDGSVFNLSASSRMVLDNLVYQPGGSSNALNFSFVQGTFSFVAGQIAPTGEMRLDTPVASMGIRGTAGITTVYAVDGIVIYRVIQDPGTDYTGAFVLMSLTEPGLVLATVNASDLQWVLNSPNGIPTTEPADASGQDIINELIKSYNAATGKDVPLIKGENDGGKTPNVHVVTIGSGIETGVDALNMGGLESQLVDFFAALSEDAPEEYFPTEYQTSTESETTVDSSNPILVNQPATFAGAETGNAVEDVGTSTEGTLVVTDPNQGESGVQPLQDVAGAFGTFSINEAGQWTYVLNNASTAVQALGEGVTATDSFQVTSADGSATVTIVITITGTNDGATIAGDQIAGAAVEDGSATASGSLAVSDPDTGESVFQGQTGQTSAYGMFSITAAGQWTYVLNNSGAAVQALGAGVTVTDSFQVVSADGTATETVVITITGSNDGATIQGTDLTGAVTEDGTATATGSLSVSDVDTGESVFQVQAGTGSAYGTFSITAAGQWTFVLNNDSPAVQALTAGQTVTDSFQVVSADGTATQTVVVTITGGNDGAVIVDGPAPGNGFAGAVTEDVTTTANGSLAVSDPDAGQSAFQIQSGVAGTYGTFSIDASGQWTYALNNGLPAVQALAAGATITETFPVTSADGSATSNVVITITGSNDGAVISDGAAPGDGFTGAVVEDGTATATGSLAVADPDTGESAFQVQSGLAGTYGSFSIDASGQWTYALNNGSSAVQGLTAGQIVTDTFQVVSADGTATENVVITITGSGDGAQIVDGPTPGNGFVGDVTEDVATTTTGGLAVSDPDAGQSAFQIQSGTESAYGTFSIDASGQWSYALNNGSSIVQELPAGATVTDTFAVTSADGSATSNVVITIHGTNDGAVIAGDTTGNVYEDSESGSTFGDVTSSDIDGVDNSFQPVSEPTETASGNGSYTIGADGQWTYAVNNDSVAVDALNNNETLTDSFTIYAADGTPQVIEVTVHGSNDAPVGVADSPQTAGDALQTTEDTALVIDPAALLGNDNDVDNDHGDLSITNVEGGSGGSVNVTDGGMITFTPDHDFSGQATFTYQVKDPSGALSDPVTVTVNVAPDADTPYLKVASQVESFENGLGDWSSTPNVAIGQSSAGDYVAQDGSHFLEFTTHGTSLGGLEAFLGLTSGALNTLNNGTTTVGSAAYTTLQVHAGDVITFSYNFVTGDYTPYNDYGFATFNGQVVELADVGRVETDTGHTNDQQEGGSTLSTGWHTYSYTVTQTGTLTLGFGVADVGDARFDSYLLIDKITVTDSTAGSVAGDVGAAIPLAISSHVTDPSESLSIAISGVPADALLSAGTDNGDGTWTLTANQLAGLTITAAEGGEIHLTITATSTDGTDTAQTTATIDVTVNGFENLDIQSFSSEMSLMAADTGEPAQMSMLVPSTDPAPIDTPENERREAEGRNASDLATLQTLAAAAGFTALGAHWAHAAQHELSDNRHFDVSNLGPREHSDHAAPFAKFERGAELAHDSGRPDLPSLAATPDSHHLNPATLSDIISHHFSSLSGDDPAVSDFHSAPDKVSSLAPGDPRSHVGADEAGPRSHAEKSEAHHGEPHRPEPAQSEVHHDAAGKAEGLGGIVDFSSLPLPVHGGSEASGKADLAGHFKFGDLSGMLDFSRDLLPNSPGSAGDTHAFERGGAPGPVHHAAPPEAIHHVAINDVIQHMASDADVASHHAH